MTRKRITLWFTFIVGALLLTACGGDGKNLTKEGSYVGDQDWKVEDFSYTNESGEAIGLEQLGDEVWLADLIFTNCTSVCPPMSANMAKLQEQFEEAGMEVPLVSFSVDPDFDTPEVLTEYAERYEANLDTWHFLTGYSFEEIQAMSEDTFKVPLMAPVEGDDQFTHGVLFYLIDGDQIIKTYNGVSDVPFDAIVEDVKALKEA